MNVNALDLDSPWEEEEGGEFMGENSWHLRSGNNIICAIVNQRGKRDDSDSLSFTLARKSTLPIYINIFSSI